MGRGNVCTHNECEGLYYLDNDFIDVYTKVDKCGCDHVIGRNYDFEPKTARALEEKGIFLEDSDWVLDEFDTNQNWKYMIDNVTKKLMTRFKSFRRTNRWRNREIHIVLENEFFEIAVVDGGWCAAWCLLEREDVIDVGSNRTLMRRHYQTYLEAIKRALIDGWGEAIGYGGAWTHGKIYRKEDVA